MLLWLTSGHSYCKLAYLLLKASQEPAAQSTMTDSRVEPPVPSAVPLAGSVHRSADDTLQRCHDLSDASICNWRAARWQMRISDSIWKELWLAEFGRRRRHRESDRRVALLSCIVRPGFHPGPLSLSRTPSPAPA